MRCRALVWCAVAAVAACGGGGASAAGSVSGGGPKVATGAPARGNANLILDTEIEASGANNAFEAIQRLRPAMLRNRGNNAVQEGSGGVNAIMLYVDGIPQGTIDHASNVGALTVKEIRYINASDATTRFGTGHPLGAVLITSKRR